MSDTPIEEVTDYEVVDAHITSRLLDLHTSFPAKVESYNASTQTVDVVPCLNRALPDGAGNMVSETLPKLGGVKVCFPRCGGFFVSLPIQAGDYVLVVCSERNIGNWRATGNQGDPGDLGMHTLDGAVAIPGVFPDSKALTSADATNMVIGSDTAPGARIAITPSGVEVGGNSDFVALAAKVMTELQAIKTAHNTHVHILTIPTGGGSGTAAAPAIQYSPGAGVGAQNVKAT
jgi:hypothetical protein